jgi:exoribonuclease-2
MCRWCCVRPACRPSLPARDPRSRVTVEIDHINLLDSDARARWVGDLAALTGAVAVSEEELAEEIAEAVLPPDTPPAEAPVPELPVVAPESGEAD